MKPNLDLLVGLEVFPFGDDDDDLDGGAKFVYVAIEARKSANNSGNRFFSSWRENIYSLIEIYCHSLFITWRLPSELAKYRWHLFQLTAWISSPWRISFSAQKIANGWCVAIFWLFGPALSPDSYKHDDDKMPKKWSIINPDSSAWVDTHFQNSIILLKINEINCASDWETEIQMSLPLEWKISCKNFCAY